MNGVLNLSILDGWWPEGCEHGVNGWSFGNAESGNDEHDLDSLYRVLEQDVLPAWADPPRWTAMMQASIAMGTRKFSAERMVRDYFEKLYSAEPEVARQIEAEEREAVSEAVPARPSDDARESAPTVAGS
jgi:glucan phosphorylase